jgi:hypothetical protein
VAGRVRSTEKSNDIGNRTRDLLACSIVPQPAMTSYATACPDNEHLYSFNSITIISIILTYISLSSGAESGLGN